MTFTRIIQRQIAPILTSGILAGTFIYPINILNAESPDRQWSKKPIYDENEDASASASSINSSLRSNDTSRTSKSPTTTDRLAVQIGKARLFLYGHVSSMEDKLNQLVDSAFHLEESFTSTIASLAPAPHTGEKIMPGSLYVLVAAMTGSIVARRRNILLRATLPLTVGITAGWILLPFTFQNISNLIWKYEQRFPVVADGHIRTREAIKKAEMMAKIHSQQAIQIVNDKVSASRSIIEDWVGKGK